jgi:heme oxygenase
MREAPLPGALEALRAGTRDRHQALEHALDLTAEAFDRPHYVRLLERFLGLYAPLERALERWAPALARLGLPLEARWKAGWLRQDLAAFNGAPSDTLPECPDAPRLDTVEAALGCLYVLEGSTLGGQVLSRHYHAQLGLTPDTGLRFFTAYGAQTGAQWKAFLGLLHAQLVTPSTQARAVDTAVETFAAFQRWLPEAGAR